MTTISNFISAAQECLAKIPLKKVSLPEETAKIVAEDGSIDLSIYQAEKVEKVVYSIIKIKSASVSEESVMVWPADTHNLPLLWLNFTQMPGMNIIIFDFIPLLDLVVWTNYGERYMSPLCEVRGKVIDILKDTITDKAFELRSLVSYALSPYRLLLMISNAGVTLVPQAVREYASTYIECWEKAQPLLPGELHDYFLRKKKATRKLMKENDPGYHFMLNVFGEENTKKVFDTIF